MKNITATIANTDREMIRLRLPAAWGVKKRNWATGVSLKVPVVVAYPPIPARQVLVARAEEKSPESLTTCYQGRSGSCWTEE